jgi:hypothetical protein
MPAEFPYENCLITADAANRALSKSSFRQKPTGVAAYLLTVSGLFRQTIARRLQD